MVVEMESVLSKNNQRSFEFGIYTFGEIIPELLLE
jgi:hypothetical protein